MSFKSLSKKWWFYLLLVIFFFIPIYTTTGYDPRNINIVILDLLKSSSETYKVAAPFFHIVTIIIIILLIIFKNKIRQIFNIYVCISFFFFAFAQGVFFTDKYGLAIMGSYVIIFSIIGIYWIWEIIIKQNDFTLPKILFGNTGLSLLLFFPSGLQLNLNLSPFICLPQIMVQPFVLLYRLY